MKLVSLPCYCATLRQAARSATAFYQAALGTSGLQVTQYTLLQTLHDIPNLTTTELGQAVGMDQTTATRMLALIKRRGFVAAKVGHDRREKRWALTPAGSKMLHALSPAWEAAQAAFEKQLSAPVARALKESAFMAAMKLGGHASGVGSP